MSIHEAAPIVTSPASPLETPHESAGRSTAIVPRISISIRQATMADLAWIDELQKLHNKQVGFMPRMQLESYVTNGNVLIAESSGREGVSEGGQPARPLKCAETEPLGYVISRDRYFKRDDCGIIYQLNVQPFKQRNLIGAMLVKAVFERAAYGCKLFSCWCAQDIAANHFWESIGFVPLAFRAGSRGKERIHIFWQRRIREGDTGPGATPYWYPSQTNAGALREDRLVFPMPPGTHWSDAKPMVLPGCDRASMGERTAPLLRERKKRSANVKHVRPMSRPAGGLWFAGAQAAGEPKPSQAVTKKRVKQRNDPRHVAMARELRDRYLEEFNSGRMLAASPDAAKYDVSRPMLLAGETALPLVGQLPPRQLLEAA
jgi:hypothetical protein